MLQKFSIFILIILLQNSCKVEEEKYPETVLGIKLGESYKEQCNILVANGKLMRSIEGILFIDFGRYKGSFMETLFSDEKTLQSLRILFVDPNNQGILKGSNARTGVLTESERDEILTMYLEKYGKSKIEIDEYGWTRHIWERDNLKITLGYKVQRTNEGYNYYMSHALYSLDEKLEKKIDNSIKKSNEKI